MKYWLIAWEFPDYPATDTPASVLRGAQPHPAHGVDAVQARAMLERLYPGRRVYSPLEHWPDGMVVSVYVSPNRRGEGRAFSNFCLYSIGKPRTT